jgi:bifunctional non-homologous end joining protein LigD
MDGVLKSWAVPKGPSLNPTEQRLAVKVEDHPMEYGDFEGVIPEGNYGAGPVIVWDKGTYRERSSSTRAQSEAALKKGLAKGHLTFVLEGEKLQGEFALVRMQTSRNWLLIKKGDAFSSYKKVEWDNRSVVSRQNLEKLKKEKKSATWTRAGRSELPRVRQAIAVGKSHAPVGKEWVFQDFGSGERALAEVEEGKVRLLSRTRLSLAKKFPAVVQGLEKLSSSLVLDGELKSLPESFEVLDLLYYDGKDLREQTLQSRLKKLQTLKLPKPLSIAPFLKKASSQNWIAREKSSPYVAGLNRGWIHGKNTRTTPLVITNSKKKLWPKEGYTKQNLVDYYQAVAQSMLPHLRNRPLSLHRFPNGIQSPGFFQKDLTGYLPPEVRTFAHYSDSSSRTIHYALCQDETTLLYLANLACIEINPWLCRVPLIDSPDFCVIDLDPDGNPFEEVIEVAQAYKKILDRWEIESFCKTSGATGLHLCIPWHGKSSFDLSREFALRISQQIREIFPTLTSLERSPAKRRKKIYLDCFQNARSQTIVAPYSVRPLPGAPVSTPLHWKELKRGLSPRDFTLETVPPRLRSHEDPWENLSQSRNNLLKILRKFK